jgi:hypothetical protein
VHADAGEADLAGLLGDLLGFQEVVGELRGGLFAVEIPDVDVVGPELFEAGVQVRQRLGLVLPSSLGGDVDLLALARYRTS